eukprot:TRINITY_DN430_c0_g2_i1.p1 TRINITY_DN430_c0_g2~~TRINITY_DN430_c0_g2_i1.p1  ORF type:complete len:778 (-),score=161.23 TRINITY_DN430_c0_g2_i1:52-2385(-)
MKYFTPSGRPTNYCYRYFCNICDRRDIQISAGDIVKISKPSKSPEEVLFESPDEFLVLSGNGGPDKMNPQLNLRNLATGLATTAYANALVPVSKQRCSQTHAESARASSAASSSTAFNPPTEAAPAATPTPAPANPSSPAAAAGQSGISTTSSSTAFNPPTETAPEATHSAASPSSPAAAAAQSTPTPDVAPEATLGEAPAAQAGAKQFWSPSGQPSDYQYLYRCQKEGCLIRDKQVQRGDKVVYSFLKGVTLVISGNGGRSKYNPQVRLKDDSLHSVLDLIPLDEKRFCRFHPNQSSAIVDVSPETKVPKESEFLHKQIVATIKQFEKQEASETERALPKTLVELEKHTEDDFLKREAHKFEGKSQEMIFRRLLAIMTSKREQIQKIKASPLDISSFAMYKAICCNLIAIFTTARVISTGLIQEPASTVSNVFSTLGTAAATFAAPLAGPAAPAVSAITSGIAMYFDGKIKAARADAFRKILLYCLDPGQDQELAELIARRLCQRYINQIPNMVLEAAAEDARNIALTVLVIMIEENLEVSKEFPLEDLAEQIVARVGQLSAPTFLEKWLRKVVYAAVELATLLPQGKEAPEWITRAKIIAIGPQRVFAAPETSTDLSSIPTTDWRYGTEAEALALELHEKECKAEGFDPGHIFSMTEQEKIWKTGVDHQYDLLGVALHLAELTDRVHQLEPETVDFEKKPDEMKLEERIKIIFQRMEAVEIQQRSTQHPAASSSIAAVDPPPQDPATRSTSIWCCWGGESGDSGEKQRLIPGSTN